MSMWDWFRARWPGGLQTQPDPAKVTLSERQLDVAGRLAHMKGVTRDEVLAEAYRRADRIVRARR